MYLYSKYIYVDIDWLIESMWVFNYVCVSASTCERGVHVMFKHINRLETQNLITFCRVTHCKEKNHMHSFLHNVLFVLFCIITLCTYFFLTPRSENGAKNKQVQFKYFCGLFGFFLNRNDWRRISAAYLQSGWPARSRGRPRWFWLRAGWQAEQLPRPWPQGSRCSPRCSLQCCPQCFVALQRASASRLIRQTLGWRERRWKRADDGQSLI